MPGRTRGRCGWVSAVTTDRACARRVSGSPPQPGDPSGPRPPTPSFGGPSDTPPSLRGPRGPHPCTRFGRSQQPPTWWSPELREEHSGRAAGLRGPASATQPGGPPVRAPTFPLPEGGRETTLRGPALPGVCCAPWRPPRGRALGTRGSLSGPPFPGSAPAAGGGPSPLSAPIRAPRAEPSPLSSPQHARTPGSPVATLRPPQPCVKVPAGEPGGLLSARCAPPAALGLSSTGRKNAACTHLFILQQLQETMKLFKKRGNALSSRAVVFNEPLGPRTARPPRSLRASPPQPAPVPGPARRRGHCFWSPAGGKGACRVAGAVRVGAGACERARARVPGRARAGLGGRRRCLAASPPRTPTPRLRSARS